MYIAAVPEGIGSYFWEREDKIFKGMLHVAEAVNNEEKDYEYSCLRGVTFEEFCLDCYNTDDFESMCDSFFKDYGGEIKHGTLVDDAADVLDGEADGAYHVWIQGHRYVCGVGLTGPDNDDDQTFAAGILKFLVSAGTLARIEKDVSERLGIYKLLLGKGRKRNVVYNDEQNAATVDLFFRLSQPNSGLSVDTYASHSDWIIRQVVAEKTNSKHVLQTLINDPNPVVSCAALVNNAADVDMAGHLLFMEDTDDDRILAACVRAKIREIDFRKAMPLWA